MTPFTAYGTSHQVVVALLAVGLVVLVVLGRLPPRPAPGRP